MSAIDQILLLLKDGNWHKLEEIMQIVSLSQDKTEKIVSFLNEYEFVDLRDNSKEVKIQSTIREFIKEIQRLEKEASESTIS